MKSRGMSQEGVSGVRVLPGDEAAGKFNSHRGALRTRANASTRRHASSALAASSAQGLRDIK